MMLILASRSSARRALLSGAGLTFEVVPATLDEREAEAGLKGNDPAGLARGLAEAKAAAVAVFRPEAVVIGADQTLSLGTDILHKPTDLADARAELDRLRGRTHELHAGIALAIAGAIIWSDVETAELTLRDFSDAERDAALALEGEAALSSVGGYRLEGPSIRLFDRIAGDYFTILGLPLLPLLAALRLHAPETLEPS